jgi:hypothetical protein
VVARQHDEAGGGPVVDCCRAASDGRPLHTAGWKQKRCAPLRASVWASRGLRSAIVLRDRDLWRLGCADRQFWPAVRKETLGASFPLPFAVEHRERLARAPVDPPSNLHPATQARHQLAKHGGAMLQFAAASTRASSAEVRIVDTDMVITYLGIDMAEGEEQRSTDVGRITSGPAGICQASDMLRQQSSSTSTTSLHPTGDAAEWHTSPPGPRRTHSSSIPPLRRRPLQNPLRIQAGAARLRAAPLYHPHHPRNPTASTTQHHTPTHRSRTRQA